MSYFSQPGANDRVIVEMDNKSAIALIVCVKQMLNSEWDKNDNKQRAYRDMYSDLYVNLLNSVTPNARVALIASGVFDYNLVKGRKHKE